MGTRIQKKALVFEDLRGKERPRVIPSDSLINYLNSTIFNTKCDFLNNEPDSEEERLIEKNYSFLKEKIETELLNKGGADSKLEYLQELFEKIAKLEVIWIKIEDEEAAYEVFETVNDRGAELSIADLLKNLIFKKLKALGKDIDYFKDRWKNIEENISKQNIDMKKFFRHFWLSKYSFVTEKKLFKEIKKTLTKDKDYIELLEELVSASDDYGMLLKGSYDDWIEKEDGDKIYDCLRGIRAMKVVQCHSLFLSSLRNLKKINKKPFKVFKLIENFSFLYSIVGKQPSNKLEKIYSNYSRQLEKETKKIDKHTLSNIDRILTNLENELRSLKPTIEHLGNNFKNITYSANNILLIAYILEKINSIFESGEHKINFESINIEHFLPRNPNKDWNITKEESKDFVNNIGNLTILLDRINKKAGNKGPKEKCEILKKSDIHLTKQLVENIERSQYRWGKEEIEKRQKDLINLALEKVWIY